MGRPLAKRFFSGGSGVTIGCSYHDGSSVVESAIISQISNTKYRVAGGGATPLVFTDLSFLEANPDTITRNGGDDLTLTFSAGDQVRVASADTAANDGVYTIAIVTSTVITLSTEGDLATDASDTNATLALVAPNGVVAKLVQGTPTALGEMQVTVLPELLATADEMEIDFGTSDLALITAGQDETDYAGPAFTAGTNYMGGATSNDYTAGLVITTGPNTITRSDGSTFTSDDIGVGQKLTIASAEDGGNDGDYTITNVTDTAITVTETLIPNADDDTMTLAVFDVITLDDGSVVTVDTAGTSGTPAPITAFTVTVADSTPLAETTVRAQASVSGAIAAGFDMTPDDANEIPRGVVTSVVIVNAGSGYFSGGTFTIGASSDIRFIAGTEAVIAYTVNASQEVASVAVQSGGVGYQSLAASTNVNTADLPDPESTGTLESARIINARTVKTFEGNIYMWPALGATGSLKTRGEADLQTSDL